MTTTDNQPRKSACILGNQFWGASGSFGQKEGDL